MTPEDKQLLLRDLCARIPYGVRYKGDGGWGINPYQHSTTLCNILNAEEPLVYLRPMSSMTEGEYKEFCKISGLYKKEEGNYFSNHLPEWGNSIITEKVMVRTIDWLNAHHFDYRGLIPKGLALEAPEEMY